MKRDNKYRNTKLNKFFSSSNKNIDNKGEKLAVKLYSKDCDFIITQNDSGEIVTNKFKIN